MPSPRLTGQPRGEGDSYQADKSVTLGYNTDMNTTKPQFYFLLSLLVISGVLSFFVFRPFLYAFVLALICAVVLQPIFRRLVKYTKGRRGLSSILTIIIVVVFILIPATLFSIMIVRDAREVYVSLITSEVPINTYIISFLNKFTAIDITSDITVNFDQYFSQGMGWIVQHLGSLFNSFAQLFTSVLVFMISLYYILKDGQYIRITIINLSPLSESDDETILNNLQKSVNAVIRGNILVAIIQGLVAMVGLTAFGVPNAVLWGSVAAVAALIPIVGTSIVIIPSVLYLILTDNFLMGIGLLIWGLFAVGLVDNLIAPKLVGKEMKLHPLIVLLSVLGGIVLFGPIGFIIGPLVISLFWALANVFMAVTNNKRITA